MITQIEIKERTWNEEKQHYELKYKTITRDEYSGDFDELILDNMDTSDIKDYAENELDMKREGECDCHIPTVDEFHTEELIYELEGQGYKVIKCQTLADAMKLEKVQELMQIS